MPRLIADDGAQMGNYSALANGLSVLLHSSAAVLDGTGGASVASWQDPDNAGNYLRAAWLVFANNGSADVTIGDAQNSISAFLVADGVAVAPLFSDHAIILAPGELSWCPLPPDVAALGRTWAVSSPLSSGSTVAITVHAIPVTSPDATGGGSSPSTIAAAVDAVLSAAHGAGSWALAAADVWGFAVEGTETAADALRLASAWAAGKIVKGAGGMFSLFSKDAAKARIVGTFANGVRTILTRDGR